jgi:acyl carrier protein phosphodiesterase
LPDDLFDDLYLYLLPFINCESLNFMNYLAHLYLSEPTEDGWLGSLLGDFVKGPLDGRYNEDITRAIILHRKIDSFTDAHPVVLQSKSRVSVGRRRYAGIMIDMFYDHFLAKNWAEFHGEPIRAFTARIYDLLNARHTMLPDRLRYMAPRMAQSDWLASYAQLDGIHVALDRMGKRLKRENRLRDSACELREHYAGLESDFRIFMPQVQMFAKQYRLTAVDRLQRSSRTISTGNPEAPGPGTPDDDG